MEKDLVISIADLIGLAKGQLYTEENYASKSIHNKFVSVLSSNNTLDIDIFTNTDKFKKHHKKIVLLLKPHLGDFKEIYIHFEDFKNNQHQLKLSKPDVLKIELFNYKTKKFDLYK